jgi:ubiquinone/menaquinone biosynthesis C-methylase UbiE
MIVLEVACGAAHAAEIAAPHVRQVIGLDITPTLLDLGAQRLDAAGITNVLLQEGNATALPFVDGSFDLVVCRNSLHHFSDVEQALAEMSRVCRPGGRVVASDMVCPRPPLRDALDEVHTYLDPSHVRVLLEAEMADMMGQLVGPLSYAETAEPVAFSIHSIFTEMANQPAVMAALHEELDGGRGTGLDPRRDGDHIMVSFTNTVIHATKTSTEVEA